MDCCKNELVSGSSRDRAQYRRAISGSLRIVSSKSLLFSLKFFRLAVVQSLSVKSTGTFEAVNEYSKDLPPCNVCSRSGSGNPESMERKALSGSSVCKEVLGSPQSARAR